MYKRILVPVDGSPTSERGLVEAIAIATEQGATLQLFHVNDLHLFSYASAADLAISDSSIRAIREAGRKVLELCQGKAKSQGITCSIHSSDAIVGSVAGFIADKAQELESDLIVMGTHGRRGFRKMVLGSDAAAVAALSSVPVLLVRGTKPE